MVQAHKWNLLHACLAAGAILQPAMREGERFFATMCNPPFFERLEEAGRNPSTDFRGTAAEMCCPGGEAAFVRRMLQDSLELKVGAFLTPLIPIKILVGQPHMWRLHGARMSRSRRREGLWCMRCRGA